ncbi:Uncharacterised protein [Mycobacteroides abscessus subsp. abscessus]|nr:Uncharacterised protein [Mycobacteroides abscessus subsp. abscessus]
MQSVVLKKVLCGGVEFTEIVLVVVKEVTNLFKWHGPQWLANRITDSFRILGGPITL